MIDQWTYDRECEVYCFQGRKGMNREPLQLGYNPLFPLYAQLLSWLCDFIQGSQLTEADVVSR